MVARLHHQLRDVTVGTGTLLVGRAMECDLPLEDPLVSRRHALIRVETTGAFVEDLGSRNGVFLNGMRIDKPEKLHHGDEIRLGSQSIAFLESPTGAPAGSTPPSPGCHALQSAVEGDGERPSPSDSNDPAATETSSPMTKKERLGNGLSFISGIAEKALALGRVEDAERILRRSLLDILEEASKGAVDADVIERAASCAVRLASATCRGSWIDYVFQLYAVRPALPPARLVDELYTVVRKVKDSDKVTLRAYVVRLQAISGSFGPAERFIQQRIESFERWAP